MLRAMRSLETKLSVVPGRTECEGGNVSVNIKITCVSILDLRNERTGKC